MHTLAAHYSGAEQESIVQKQNTTPMHSVYLGDPCKPHDGSQHCAVLLCREAGEAEARARAAADAATAAVRGARAASARLRGKDDEVSGSPDGPRLTHMDQYLALLNE